MARVKSVKRLNISEDLYDIGVEDNHNFFADFVLVHNCHRFSKTQIETLLPHLEHGNIILVGSTTENPFHSINSAILSRGHVYEVDPLGRRDLAKLLVRAVRFYHESGRKLVVDQDAAKHVIAVANGDGRKVISVIELIASCYDDDHITLELVKTVSPSKYMTIENKDTLRFDLASAYQGSIQASDPDAAVYWLAKWLESGEDPRYIARRLMVSASEDAAGTPEAAMVANNAYVAACNIGRPECDIVLAHATVLTACAPRDKSAAKAIWEAVKDVKHGDEIWVPKELKDSHYAGAKELGHGSYKDGCNQEKYAGIKKQYYFPRNEN